MWYNWPLVLLSLLAAILASATALHVATGSGMSLWRTLSGSIVMGAGIGAMHYIGMYAMRMGAMCHFNPLIVLLSVILAVVISFVALRLVFRARNDGQTRLQKFASAALMGAAIPVLHYTGMAAATFRASSAAPDLAHAVDVSTLGVVGIAVVTFMVLGIASLASAQHRMVREPNVSMRTRTLSARIRALSAAMTTFCIMAVFEAAKQAIHPKITIWTSHSITILFTTLVAAVLSFMILSKEERIRFELAASEKRYRSLFERNLAGVYRSTLDGRILDCNSAFYWMLGYTSREDLMAHSAYDFYFHADGRSEFIARLRSVNRVTNLERCLRRKDGGEVWVLESAALLVDEDGSETVIDGTLIDITERKVAEQRVKFLAYYDALTELPNRTLLHDRLGKAIASARRRKDKVALLFLDLDRFKIINDSLGHSYGDLFLQEVAARLKRWAREQDTVARVGGDEFVIVLTTVKDISDAAVAGERLMDAMTPEFVVQSQSFNVTCSLGISIFPEHGTDAETLIKNADAAMYCAKDLGRNNFQFYTEEMNAQVVERLTLERSLRGALDKKELSLMYQPQVDIATGRITGLEALLRWQHPQVGPVPPDKFIRIAENSGLIIPIGEWVLRTACFQVRKWQDEGLHTVPMGVNVSAIQFRQEGFCELVRRVLQETGLAPRYLDLELTESLLLSDADVMLPVFQELNAMGLKLTIDDFGTGYSSLRYLRKLQVGKIKIDRSFVRDIAVNADDAAITTAIISMAKSLKLRVIAEGVENEAQMSFLRAHQCDEIQGYYFSRPLPADHVAEKLRGMARALSAKYGL